MLCVWARTQGQEIAASPYSEIPTRNAFGLKSEQPDPPITQPMAHPPEILPDGIITIFGRPQVMFKVVEPADFSGKRTNQQEFYTLAEGQQKSGVRVTHIDAERGVVTFNNHGTIEELPLTNFSQTVTRPNEQPKTVSVQPSQIEPNTQMIPTNLNYSRFYNRAVTY